MPSIPVLNRLSLFLGLFLAAACAGGPQGTPPGPVFPEAAGEDHAEPAQAPLPVAGGARVSFAVVQDSIPGDPALEQLVRPFRARMAQEIQEVIGEVDGILTKAVPEGTLGNFAADAMLWAANRAFPDRVHMAMTNNGGLRVPVGPGPITLGQMYELMPFENLLSVLTLSGRQVQTLCNELAELRGEPIAGFSFVIQEEQGQRVARDIRIGGEPLDPSATYRLVTNDYLANGGGTLTPIHSPLQREDLPVLLRDAFVEYTRHLGVIEPILEGRIQGGIGQ